MKKTLIFSAALILIFQANLLAQESETKYTNESVARLSHISGKVFIQRASDLGYEEGILNSPVSEGDRIASTDGRVEIHFGPGNYLRLDDNTKIDIMNLPKKGDDEIRFRVWSGSVYLTIGSLRKEKNIELHSADSSFYILDKGIYRVDVQENKDTELLVFRGLVEAAGESGSLLVKSGQRLEVAEGRFKSKPSTFMAVDEDSFDRFNSSRNSEISRATPKRYLPEELRDFEYELEQYGQWVYLAPYGYVWVPGGIESGWRPYWNGRWVWLGISGWTWVPYEPWGWVTFHYGRWHWAVGFGWYWIPTSIWGPAWVSWWWDMDYIGWAPLSWWGYPVVIVNGEFYGRYYGPNYPWNSQALTVIRKDQLRETNVSRVNLKPDSLQGISKISLTNQTLNLRPVGSKISVESLNGNRVILRKESSDFKIVPSNEKSRLQDASRGKVSGTGSGQPAAKANESKGENVRQPERTQTKEGIQTKPEKESKPAERKIRKKDSEPFPALEPNTSSSVNSKSSPVFTRESASRTIKTYPSSPDIHGPASSGRTSPRIIRDGTSGNPGYSTGSSQPSWRSGSGISTPRSTPGISSRPHAGSSSRPSSGSGRSSSSSGGVRKKH